MRPQSPRPCPRRARRLHRFRRRRPTGRPRRLSSRSTLAAGALAAGFVACASGLAWPGDSPLVPRHGGHARGDALWGWLFLTAAGGALVAYVAGLRLIERRRVTLRSVAIVAVAVQLAPLAAPLLLSTDAWTYWSYGRIAAVHDENPYASAPADFPDDPALPHVGTAWRETPSVYGPLFTLGSEGVATVSRSSEDAAAWSFKALAAAGMLAATVFAVRLAARRQFACAFVGWNPVVALHAAGGGHNDAWMAALVLAALALTAVGRGRLAGAAWAAAVLVKWIPLLFLPLRLAEPRTPGRRSVLAGFLAAGAALAALSTWRYGLEWLRAVEPVARKASEQTSFALPSRIAQVGVPRELAATVLAAAFAAAYVWLLRQAAAGRARLALAAVLLLLTTPWLVVWYLGWAVALAAAEDDRTAQWLTVALSVYLLPQAVPL